jgi:hypothetical protein
MLTPRSSAENAYQAKDISKTIAEYDAALRAYPMWPEGHYNLATLAGEIGGRPGHDIAIFHNECLSGIDA